MKTIVTRRAIGELSILHVITGLHTGGAEMVLCQLLETLRPPTFEHTVVCLGTEAALSPRVSRSAKLYHLGMRPGRLTPADVLHLRSIIRRSRPHFVQGWMYHANLMAILAAWGTRIPVIWGMHYTLGSLAEDKRSTRCIIRASAYLSRRARRIIYCSMASLEDHERYGYSKRPGVMIPNGFDINVFRLDPKAGASVRAEIGIAPDAPVIGLVARMHPMKDHENFLRAAALFTVEYPRAVFMLVGDGVNANNEKLGRLIEDLHMSAHVCLCGRRTDMTAVNAAFNVASSSSSWGEAFPMVLGEAMACGTPCVATDVGDVREIIGDTGVVVPPRDPAALCAGWEKLVGMDETERHELGLRARQRIIERYSLESMARQYSEVYSVLSAR